VKAKLEVNLCNLHSICSLLSLAQLWKCIFKHFLSVDEVFTFACFSVLWQIEFSNFCVIFCTLIFCARKVTLDVLFFFFPRPPFTKITFQEVLRVERELLQIEQQELKRQRENLILRKSLARRELDEGVKMLMNPMMNDAAAAANRLSLQDVSTAITNGNSHYENLQQQQQPQMMSYHQHSYHHQQQQQQHQQQQHQQQISYQHSDYRKSMPNLLQEFGSGYHQNGNYQSPAPPLAHHYAPNEMPISSKSEMHLNHNFLPKPYQPPALPPTTHHQHPAAANGSNNNNAYSNMSRHALMQISATPKPRLTNDWIQFRKSEPAKQSINSHWLIQEAEQRRIAEQMNNVRQNNISNNSKKPLPESVIQTLTQRVQNMGIGLNVNKR